MNDNDIKKCIKNGYCWRSYMEQPSKIEKGSVTWPKGKDEWAKPFLHATKAEAKLAIATRREDEREAKRKAKGVESHETPVGETQPKEVVTDETQDKKTEKAARNTTDDSVAHPKHYTSHPSGIECIQVTEHMNFCRGNAVKYVWRAGEKGDEIEDLKKARWYLDREIARLAKAKESK